MKGLKEQRKNKRIFFIGLVALLLIAGTCLLTGCAREVRANAIVSGEHVLAEEPKRLIEYRVVESPTPEPLKTPTEIPTEAPTEAPTEVPTTAASGDIPVGGEIFTLGEGTYRETSSAKDRIGISGVYSWYESKEEGERWFGFAYENISREILDVKWTVAWKDTAGNILRTDEGRHGRLFPGDSGKPPYALPYPEKAVTYEFWVEAERSKPIPPTIAVSYAEHPTAKGNISVNYELEIQDKGMPRERWAVEIEVGNDTDNKMFKDVSLYLREKDEEGETIPLDRYVGLSSPEVYTEENFHLWKRPVILFPGQNETFRASLPWETVSLDFYVQVGEEQEVPSSLHVEYISASRFWRLYLQNHKGLETVIIEESRVRRLELQDQEIIEEGPCWRVKLIFSAPREICREYTILYIVKDLSGNTLEEEYSTSSRCRGDLCEVNFRVPRESATLYVAEGGSGRC